MRHHEVDEDAPSVCLSATAPCERREAAGAEMEWWRDLDV